MNHQVESNRLEMMFVKQVVVQDYYPKNVFSDERAQFTVAAKVESVLHFKLLRDLAVWCDFGPLYPKKAAVLLDYESMLGDNIVYEE